MPDPGPARRRRIARVLGMALGFGVAAGVALWLVRKSPPERSALTPVQTPAPASAAVPAPLPSALPVVVVAPPAQAAARSRTTRPPAAGPRDPETASVASDAAPAAPAPRAQSLADGKTYTGSVLLPGGAKIELGGIVWSEAEPRALINDRIAGVGAWVEGFTVSKIEPERVALEKDGRTIFLSLK